MAYIPAFSTSQTLGSPSDVNFTNSSTGTDGSITALRIYFQQANGSFLVPEGTTTEYVVWVLADTSTTIEDLLSISTDSAFLVTVEWVNSGGTVLYSSQQYVGYTLYWETFFYQLVQAASGNPLNMNDNSFRNNMSELRDCIDSGNQAIEFFSDLYAAQQCYTAAAILVNNGVNFFNINI